MGRTPAGMGFGYETSRFFVLIRRFLRNCLLRPKNRREPYGSRQNRPLFRLRPFGFRRFAARIFARQCIRRAFGAAPFRIRSFYLCIGWVIGWFAVTSVNGFTARAYDVPFHVRQRIADRMGNEIREVGATYFKDSGKPYSTIEAE